MVKTEKDGKTVSFTEITSQEAKKIIDMEELADKSQKILVYCRSGNRSKQAAAKLADMGYENVLEFGGILDWPYEEMIE